MPSGPIANPSASLGVSALIDRAFSALITDIEWVREHTRIGERADLMVVGGHGRECFAGVVLSSVAERVLRDAPCPVLMVRKQ